MKDKLSNKEYKDLLNKPYKIRDMAELGKLCPDGYGKCKGSYAVNLTHGFKHRAKRRSISFELTAIETFWLIQEPCTYCGTIKAFPEHNGIDRVDNSKGYSKENSVSCCKVCNYAKHIMSLDSFKKHIIRMYNHMISDLNQRLMSHPRLEGDTT